MKTGKTVEQIIYVAFRLWMKMIQSEFDFVMIDSSHSTFKNITPINKATTDWAIRLYTYLTFCSFCFICWWKLQFTMAIRLLGKRKGQVGMSQRPKCLNIHLWGLSKQKLPQSSILPSWTSPITQCLVRAMEILVAALGKWKSNWKLRKQWHLNAMFFCLK